MEVLKEKKSEKGIRTGSLLLALMPTSGVSLDTSLSLKTKELGGQELAKPPFALLECCHSANKDRSLSRERSA